ncbi:radical SAM protein [Campylobacter showae]|uniref:Radical SAM domain-containing protein n=1 Tax=Campylobacter showae CC57C TaxID=1073353 RepID=M3HYV0_9BACT|nr:radical SAM protein [Campylobacter showae]EMG29494.1 radical SAM domain-containing protein [Campylobacter showae CC57C]
MHIVFGPVSSRRFGVSLGVDLSPAQKCCNFDCVYCELTAAKPVAAIENPPSVEQVIAEVKAALAVHPHIDVITLTANGEPTLYPDLAGLVRELNLIKGRAKTLILSNGSGVLDPKICEALKRLDIVKFSLDSAVQKTFVRIDRSGEKIDISELVAVMAKFRREFKGELVLEILVVKGLNDTKVEFEALNAALNQILPVRVDISTIDRPPAYPVKGVNRELLYELAQQISGVPCVIASAKYGDEKFELSKEELLELVKRRPQSESDVTNSFSEGSKQNLQKLLADGKIKIVDAAGAKFYRLA